MIYLLKACKPWVIIHPRFYFQECFICPSIHDAAACIRLREFLKIPNPLFCRCSGALIATMSEPSFRHTQRLTTLRRVEAVEADALAMGFHGILLADGSIKLNRAA